MVELVRDEALEAKLLGAVIAEERERPRSLQRQVGPSEVGGVARFLSSIREEENGCWRWTGAPGSEGYGSFSLLGKNLRAHVASYLLFVGSMYSVGSTVNHLCHDRDLTCAGGVLCEHRMCVRPSHLELATYSRNNAGGRLGYENRADGMCRNHLHNIRDPKNVYTNPNSGHRQCLPCKQEAMRKRRGGTSS